MISKELLSELYDFDVREIIKLGTDDVTYEVRFDGLKNGHKYNIINIYELAHILKQWAYKRGYLLDSRVTQAGSCFLSTSPISEKEDIKKTFVAKSEPQAIFKACKYILKKEIN